MRAGQVVRAYFLWFAVLGGQNRARPVRSDHSVEASTGDHDKTVQRGIQSPTIAQGRGRRSSRRKRSSVGESNHQSASTSKNNGIGISGDDDWAWIANTLQAKDDCNTYIPQGLHASPEPQKDQEFHDQHIVPAQHVSLARSALQPQSPYSHFEKDWTVEDVLALNAWEWPLPPSPSSKTDRNLHGTAIASNFQHSGFRTPTTTFNTMRWLDEGAMAEYVSRMQSRPVDEIEPKEVVADEFLGHRKKIDTDPSEKGKQKGLLHNSKLQVWLSHPNNNNVGAGHARKVVQDYPNTSIVAEYKRYRRYLKSRLIHQDYTRTPEEKRTPLMRIQERRYQRYEEYLKRVDWSEGRPLPLKTGNIEVIKNDGEAAKPGEKALTWYKKYFKTPNPTEEQVRKAYLSYTNNIAVWRELRLIPRDLWIKRQHRFYKNVVIPFDLLEIEAKRVAKGEWEPRHAPGALEKIRKIRQDRNAWRRYIRLKKKDDGKLKEEERDFIHGFEAQTDLVRDPPRTSPTT